MIRSFKGKETEKIFHGLVSLKFPADIQRRAFNKLGLLQAALVLADLKAPLSNHLEELKGDRQGQHSIRINDQFRICFHWQEGGADDVEIVDYHK